MGRIEVKTDISLSDKNEKIPLPLVTLLLLTAGVFGILLFIRSLDGVEYQMKVVLPAAAFLCCAVWYCYAKHKKLFWVILLMLTAGCALSVILLWDVLTSQTTYIVNSLLGEPAFEPVQITETALLLAAILSVLLFVLECLIKSHAVLYVFTTMLLLIAPFFGIRANVETVFLLLLFQLAFWGIQTAGSGRKKKLIAGSRNRLAGKSGFVISIAVVLTFSAALPLVITQAEKLYNYVYMAEGFVSREMNTMSGRAGELVRGGSINRGNNYPTGTVHLSLTVLTQPTETLYLRGFSGGKYIGGDWIQSNDEALFDNITRIFAEQGWHRNIGKWYDSMYFNMNESMETAEPLVPITLMIQYMTGWNRDVYAPYYSQYTSTLTIYGDLYFYYEQKDMNINCENILPRYEQQGQWYQEFQQVYMEQAKEVYSQVPTELLPRLTALVEENPLTELDEITAFILYTLNSNATYTLTPGWTSFNEDIVEYFLFERGTGFCEHFAATAALMYRLYGIPARYATGYRVSPSDFESQWGGIYTADVTDEAAHAWVEIFLEDYGWTPVEVTPASDGSAVASYPGFDSVQMNRIWRNQGWDVTVPSLTKEPVGELSSVGHSEGTDFVLEIDGEEFRNLFLVLILCVVYSILLLPLFLDYRRLWILEKAETKGCRATYGKLMDLIHFGNIMPEYDGSEEDFADRLAEKVAGISQDEARLLVAVVNKAAFSSVQPEDSEEAFVRRLYQRTAAWIYTGLSWKKKFIFKLIKVFG